MHGCRAVEQQRPGEHRLTSKRSARKPRQKVPTNRPAKVAATKAPIPEKPKKAWVVVVISPAAGEARRDVAGEEQAVDFEAAAERGAGSPAARYRRRRAGASSRRGDRSGPLVVVARSATGPSSTALMMVLPSGPVAAFLAAKACRPRMFGSRKPEIQTNISKQSFDVFDQYDPGRTFLTRTGGHFAWKRFRSRSDASQAPRPT